MLFPWEGLRDFLSVFCHVCQFDDSYNDHSTTTTQDVFFLQNKLFSPGKSQ